MAQTASNAPETTNMIHDTACHRSISVAVMSLSGYGSIFRGALRRSSRPTIATSGLLK